jgi:hypothetical protein
MKALSRYLRNIILITLIPLKSLSQDDLLAYAPGSVCKNYINIVGSTNLNKFEFRMDFPMNQIFSIENSSLIAEKHTGLYEIPLPVKGFEVNNQILYHDFLTLLKANQHPEIIIGIGYQQLLDFLEGENYSVKTIQITLAGITRVYPVACVVSPCSENLVYISGYKHIKLTDFNLYPPEKFQGLIKVENDVMINFGFVFLFREENKNL